MSRLDNGERDRRFFELARKQAEKSDFPQKLGCVVVYHGKVISEGHNQKRTHPQQVKYDKCRSELIDGTKNAHSLHAESCALFKIMGADIKWSKVELYIYRALRSRPFGLAKPCPSCTALIKELGIKKIHYTTNENSFITEYWE